jgi:hypothetical protein
MILYDQKHLKFINSHIDLLIKCELLKTRRSLKKCFDIQFTTIEIIYNYKPMTLLEEKQENLFAWIRSLDEQALDELIEEYLQN